MYKLLKIIRTHKWINPIRLLEDTLVKSLKKDVLKRY